MILDSHLYRLMAPHAAKVAIEQLCIGLRYTAVSTSDGGIGLAYTYRETHTRGPQTTYHDCEGQTAMVLLEKIKSDVPLERSQALALINALNHRQALRLPEDPDNRILYDTLGMDAGCKVAMVGYFKPLVDRLEGRGAEIEIVDLKRGLGNQQHFYDRLQDWADVLVLTATSILNRTTEEIMHHVNARVKTVILGPSTPMVAKAFGHLPVQMLAGTVPIQKDRVLKAVRHGMGTRVIHRFSKKAFWIP